ncbi:histidinol-phosphate aminotransferase, partial [Lacticaseibacillus rhamnosus]
PYQHQRHESGSGFSGLEDQTFTRKVKQQIFATRKQWDQFFDQHQIRHYATQTNFMLYQVNDPQALGTFLKQHGYLVRDSMVPGWIRQSFGTPKQDAEVQQLLLTFLGIKQTSNIS